MAEKAEIPYRCKRCRKLILTGDLKDGTTITHVCRGCGHTNVIQIPAQPDQRSFQDRIFLNRKYNDRPK